MEPRLCRFGVRDRPQSYLGVHMLRYVEVETRLQKRSPLSKVSVLCLELRFTQYDCKSLLICPELSRHRIAGTGLCKHLPNWGRPYTGIRNQGEGEGEWYLPLDQSFA